MTISHIRSTSPLYEDVLRVREAVLRVPLGLSLRNEDLSRDHVDDIFVACSGDLVIGCLLLHPAGEGTMQLRAMAVYADWQGQGIGRHLVRAAERFSQEKGIGKIVLHARKVALGFYLSLGYHITSDEFTEVGIPHYLMEKKIAAAE